MICVCISTCMSVMCMCIYVCRCVHVYIYIYTHTHFKDIGCLGAHRYLKAAPLERNDLPREHNQSSVHAWTLQLRIAIRTRWGTRSAKSIAKPPFPPSVLQHSALTISEPDTAACFHFGSTEASVKSIRKLSCRDP